jgi:L-lactate utilization protein LutC
MMMVSQEDESNQKFGAIEIFRLTVLVVSEPGRHCYCSFAVWRGKDAETSEQAILQCVMTLRETGSLGLEPRGLHGRLGADHSTHCHCILRELK